MPSRIVLIGSECTGKTTLAKLIAAHYKVPFVSEYLRSYFEMRGGNLSIDDAVPIAEGQLALEHEIEQKGHNPIICDTDIISSIVYTKHYFCSLPNWFEKQVFQRSQSLYLLCDIDVDWVADGQRDCSENRECMQSLFEKELDQRFLDYHKISGPLESRLKMSCSIIDRYLCINSSRK